MRFTKKQINTLGYVMDRLGAVLEKADLNNPLMVGLAKAYALTALSYSEAVEDRVSA